MNTDVPYGIDGGCGAASEETVVVYGIHMYLPSGYLT
jgi:hypothetical protein